MQIAELFIREKKDAKGGIEEELWVAIRRSDGKVMKRLKYRDYERKTRVKLPLRNRILLYYLGLTERYDIQ